MEFKRDKLGNYISKDGRFEIVKLYNRFHVYDLNKNGIEGTIIKFESNKMLMGSCNTLKDAKTICDTYINGGLVSTVFNTFENIDGYKVEKIDGTTTLYAPNGDIINGIDTLKGAREYLAKLYTATTP